MIKKSREGKETGRKKLQKQTRDAKGPRWKLPIVFQTKKFLEEITFKILDENLGENCLQNLDESWPR